MNNCSEKGCCQPVLLLLCWCDHLPHVAYEQCQSYLTASNAWTSLSIYLASDNVHLSAAAAAAPFDAVDEQL
jgi:hypothetical protein